MLYFITYKKTNNKKNRVYKTIGQNKEQTKIIITRLIEKKGIDLENIKVIEGNIYPTQDILDISSEKNREELDCYVKSIVKTANAHIEDTYNYKFRYNYNYRDDSQKAIAFFKKALVGFSDNDLLTFKKYCENE
jgi:hypothetical protein